MIKALFIDFDGTLIDSLDLLYEIYSEFLVSNGAQPSKKEFDLLNGTPLQIAIEKILEAHSLSLDIDNVIEGYKQLVFKRYVEEVQLTPGAQHFIEKMKNAKIKLALVTAANRPLVSAVLNANNLQFDEIITEEEVQRGKPHPEIYLKALEVMEVKPSDALAIEDSKNGMIAARLAGLECIQYSVDHSWKKISEQIL